jgi:hypothetical protein
LNYRYFVWPYSRHIRPAADDPSGRYSWTREGNRYVNAQTKSTRWLGRKPPGSPRPGRGATAGAERTRTLCPGAVPAAGSSPRHRGRHHAAFSGDGGGIRPRRCGRLPDEACQVGRLGGARCPAGEPASRRDHRGRYRPGGGQRHGREHDPDPRPPDRPPGSHSAATSIRDAATTMVHGGLRQLPVGDGTGWIGIVDIADVCGALLGPPAA